MNLTKKIILMCLLFLAVALSMWRLDHYLCQSFHPDLAWGSFNDFARQWTDIADAKWYMVPTVLILLVAGLHFLLSFKSQKLAMAFDRLREIYVKAYRFLILALISGFAVHLFKFLVGRQRPYVEPQVCEPFSFYPLNVEYTHHSMPSGHSQFIFTLLVYLSSFAKAKYRWIFWTIAFLIAFLRVASRNHFLSDIVVGAVLGGGLTYYLMEKKGWIKS